jgi:pyrroline-5-carboxylate reductase
VKRAKDGAVLLVGAGRMGGALLKGWIASARFSAIHVIEPRPSPQLRKLARANEIVLHRNFDGAIPKLSAAVIAIKPQVLKQNHDLLADIGKTRALILSIAAGVTTKFLSGALGARARLVRAMPNTPGAIGQGITVLCSHGKLAPSDRSLAQSLMQSLGETVWLNDEKLMDAVTAVSGSGPAYLFLMAEALASAARAEGLDEMTADRLARATVSGAGALLATDPRPASELRREVTSPGGTTEAALKVLMARGGLAPLMRRAVAAAAKRGKELGK